MSSWLPSLPLSSTYLRLTISSALDRGAVAVLDDPGLGLGHLQGRRLDLDLRAPPSSVPPETVRLVQGRRLGLGVGATAGADARRTAREGGGGRRCGCVVQHREIFRWAMRTAASTITSAMGPRRAVPQSARSAAHALDEPLHPRVDGRERVLAQHRALGLVVELEVHPVDGEVAAVLLGRADEVAAQLGPGGLRRPDLASKTSGSVHDPGGPARASAAGRRARGGG